MDYTRFIGRRAHSLQPSGIRKFFDIVNEMSDAISLGVGEPDFPTPWDMRAAAIKSIQRGATQYTSNAGLPALRAKIAEYLDVRFALQYDPKTEIILTVGASEAIDLCMRAMLNPDDEVLIPEPSFVSYAPCVILAGATPVPIPTSEKDCFKLTETALSGALTPKTKLLLLPFPNNPTGAIMTEDDLKPIAAFCIKHDLMVISDEIYAELTYGKKHTSIATLPQMKERTMLINGFSKAFAMTGWRLGYVCGAREIISEIFKIHQYAIMCAPSPSQYAALEGLTNGLSDNFSSIEAMREEYDTRRRFLVKRLNDMGLHCFEPEGAFYVFPSVASTKMSGEEFALKLLENQKVAVVPGTAFGASGTDYIRISYAYSISAIDKALTRIEKFLQTLTIN